ncbi:CPXCG motif-containing cysteine-rich protein [Lysobacter korlensis]|uniref:CPXCG motif-containing cysteine-rich protein n=1 Tax=Lysobacter korlensis TaxID=553636 RepID=A0ABV6RIG1_9GAMM
MLVSEFERVKCPYCGEYTVLSIEPVAEDQRYVEDCSVCCRPMMVDVHVDEDGVPLVTVESENEA